MPKTTGNHTVIAVVGTGGVDVTTIMVEITTQPAEEETTITVVVVPITVGAEGVMAVDEVVYPNHLTRPSPYVIDAGWTIIGPRTAELQSTCANSIKRVSRTRTRRQT